MSTGNRIAGYHNREATVKDLQAHEVERMRKREDVEEEMLDICHPQTIPRRTESDTEDLLRDALAEIEHWMEHAKRTEARLGAVVKRHQPVPNDAGDEVCGTCGRYWPCGERRHFDSLGIPRSALAAALEKP